MARRKIMDYHSKRRDEEFSFVKRNLDSLRVLEKESPEHADLIKEILALGKSGIRNTIERYDKLEPEEEIKYVKAYLHLEKIVKTRNKGESIAQDSERTRAVRRNYREGIEEKTEIKDEEPQTPLQQKKLYTVQELSQRLREIATGVVKNKSELKIPGHDQRRIELMYEAKKNGVPICVFEKPTNLMDLEGINELFQEFSRYKSRLRRLFSSAEPEDYGYCITGIRRPEKIMPNIGLHLMNARFTYLEKYINRKKELKSSKYTSSLNSDVSEDALTTGD